MSYITHSDTRWESIFRGLISEVLTATGDGAPAGTSIECTHLAGMPDFDGGMVVIASGPYRGQARDINGTTALGTVTPHTAFGGQITTGTNFIVTTIRTTPAEVAALAADVGDIKGAGWTDENLKTIDSLIDAIKAVTDALPDAGALNDLATLESRLTALRAGYLDELAAANIPADLDLVKADTPYLADAALPVTPTAGSIGRLVKDNLDKAISALNDLAQADILSDATPFAGADIATIKGYTDILDDAVNGLAAIKAEVEGLAGAAMRGTDNAALASVCTAARLGELDAANMPADIDTLIARLTAARAGYLDELAAANIPADVDTLKTYCDKIDDAVDGLTAIKAEVEGLAGAAMRGTDNAALASVCTEVRLAELAAANLPADIDTLLTRVTAAVALASVCTETRLAELDAANIPADVDTLLTRLSATRAGYLDNLIGTQTASTYSHPSGTTEQDAVVITPAEVGKYEELLLDLNTLTKTTTVKTYVQVDGTNYRLVDSAVFPTDFPTDTKAVVIDLTPSSRTMKVTLTSSEAEGAVRSIPYFYVVRSLA